MKERTTFVKTGFQKYEEDVVNAFTVCKARIDEEENFIAEYGVSSFIVPRNTVHDFYINYLNGRTDYEGAISRMIAYANREAKRVFKLSNGK